MILYTIIILIHGRCWYTDIYFLSESVVARMGFTQYMYKTFLNRTKDILKCVKDKTNSMHFS